MASSRCLARAAERLCRSSTVVRSTSSMDGSSSSVSDFGVGVRRREDCVACLELEDDGGDMVD